jgi:hypothetical protein
MPFGLQYGMLCDSHTLGRGEKRAKVWSENTTTTDIGAEGTAVNVTDILTEVTWKMGRAVA